MARDQRRLRPPWLAGLPARPAYQRGQRLVWLRRLATPEKLTFEQLAQRSFKQMGAGLTLREGLIKKFEFLKGERTFFTQAFRSQDCNSVVAYDYQCILEFYTGIIQRKLGVEKLPPDIAFLLRMYCEGSIHMTVEWVTTGMERPIPQLVDLLIEAMPQRLQELLSDLGK